MTVAMLIDNPDGSQALYEELRARLEIDRPAGGHLHLAGPSPSGGWRVIEVWDSVDEASRFLQERFLPALEELGFTGRGPQPQFWPVHTCLTAPGDTGAHGVGASDDARR